MQHFSDKQFCDFLLAYSHKQDGNDVMSFERLQELAFDTRLTDSQYELMMKLVREGQRVLMQTPQSDSKQTVSGGVGEWDIK